MKKVRKIKLKHLNIMLFVFVFSYLINLLWEIAHSLLYDWNKLPLQNNIYFFIPKILLSTLGDAVIISFIFLMICLFRKGFKWIYYPKKQDYFVFIIIGFIFAVGIEIRALLMNSWSYNQFMPLVFGIGLTPLVQLSITGVITLFLVSKLYIKN